MTRLAGLPAKYFHCERCKGPTRRKSVQQRYCPPCSVEANKAYKAKWTKEHPQQPDPAAEKVERDTRRDLRVANGVALSEHASMAAPSEGPAVGWVVRVAVPFDYGYSKNAVWRTSAKGHVFLREEARELRAALAEALRLALAGRRVAHNRLWLDLMVEKPDHRGDAVNVLDIVSDAVEDATGLNDRWYCVRMLDWRVVKAQPRLIVGVGQESDEDVQVCSYCGRVLPLDGFGRNRSLPLGRARTCHECSRVARTRRGMA